MTQYAFNSSIHSIIDVNFIYTMYNENSEIKSKMKNDFSRKKMSIVKEKIELHKFRQTLSNYKRNTTIKSINQKIMIQKI